MHANSSMFILSRRSESSHRQPHLPLLLLSQEARQFQSPVHLLAAYSFKGRA